MSDFIRSNFSPRRIFALFLALICFSICIGDVFGVISIELWKAVVILIVGLLLFEWAG